MQITDQVDVELRPTGSRDDVATGLRTALPACLAAVPMGLALGVVAVQTGLDWWWAPTLAAFVFAGSVEFLLIGLLAATAPLSQIALSTFLVNFRHVFYALSFPLYRVNGRAAKTYSTFALTDEAYALTATPDSAHWSRARILTIQASFHAIWVLSVAAGAGLGTLIPPQVVGLEFAVTALFLVLGIDAYKALGSVPVPLLAIGCALIASLISRENLLVIAMSLFVAALCCLFVADRRNRRA